MREVVTSASLPEPGRRRQRLETEAAAQVARIFERHGQMVYGICRTMLRDGHDAEDATQQVFLSAHSALLTGTRVRNYGSWLAAIARNECRGRINAGMRSPLPVADEDLEAVASSTDDVERRLQVQELKTALSELPDRQREALVLRYVYGLRYGEVATALGLSRPATEALLFRARRALRIRLRPVVGAVLVVPLAVRDELALAIPGFPTGGGMSAAAAGAAGGVLAKLTTGSLGMKAATTAVAVTTIGTVGATEKGPARVLADRPQVLTRADSAPAEDERGESVRGLGDGRRNAEPASTVRTGDDGKQDADSGPGNRVETLEDKGSEDSSAPGSGGAEDENVRGGSSGSSGSGSSHLPASSEPLSPKETRHDSSGPGPGGSSESSGSDSSGSGSGSSGRSGSGSSRSGSGDSGESSGSSISGSGDGGDSSGSSGPGSGSGEENAN